MKHILITGVNSYIGNKFEEWVKQWPDQYNVSKISLRNDDWKDMDWSYYDVVLHVAGIAHRKNVSKKDYMKVNYHLTIEVAKKAKKEKVKQFVFLSTMNVFGIKEGIINNNTIEKPEDMYGKSKLYAENALNNIRDRNFKISILRPPMVYGKDCPGNYAKLSKISRLTPVFPYVDNKRSMIHCDNLSEIIRIIIIEDREGVYHPQNIEYVNTSVLVKTINEVLNKKIWMIKVPNSTLKPFLTLNIFQKMFGNLMYEKTMSNFIEIDYQVNSFKKTIKMTEVAEENRSIEKSSVI